MLPIPVVTDWTAKRAGGRITLTGRDQEGQPIKIVGIDKIVGGDIGPIAEHHDGRTFRLGKAP